MYSSIMSGALRGLDSYVVNVEVDISSGMPTFDMVGFLGSEVREARERVRTALGNSGISIPAKHITVNLSPANIRKQGAAFDLPIAVAILQAMELLQQTDLKQTLIIGELGLDGRVNAVNGVLPIVIGAAENGFRRCIVPKDNAGEGAVIDGVEVIGVTSLTETFDYLRGIKTIAPECFGLPASDENDRRLQQYDFMDIQGQTAAKRGLEVAAAGFHNVLMIGPPGAGKTMLSKCMPSILPSMSMEECLEVSKIYSVSGMLHREEGLITKRPFVAPHHTITDKALAGCGNVPRPGGISMAHRGILFMDELPEFKRTTLEILRQPMEDREIRITRSHGTYTYPADFLLISAMNPCPCGSYPDLNRCTCAEPEVHRYLSKLSRPLLDRIDICLDIPKVVYKELSSPSGSESSAVIRERVCRARDRQAERYRGTSFRFNADLGVRELKQYCELGRKEQQLMESVFERLNLSARSYHRMIKVARTIADLDGMQHISERHLSEAIRYKGLDVMKYERRS